MSEKNDEGAAFTFPGKILPASFYLPKEPVMYLRDSFAVAVLPAVYKDNCERVRVTGWQAGGNDQIAAEAYAIADAMLLASGRMEKLTT